MANPLASAAMFLSLSGCPFLPHPDASAVRPPAIPCSVGPITPAATDQLSPATERQILAYDKTGAAICGWRRPR